MWFLFGWTLSLAAPSELSKALTSVKENTPECKSCLLFGAPIQNELANQVITKHHLFSVSTLDLVPSPVWTVALSPEGQAILVEARDLDGWNQMIKAEKLRLDSDQQLTSLARVFLRLTSPRSLYIPSLTKAEQKKIASGHRKAHRKGVRVVRSKNRIGLAFYAKNIAGGLERWSLLLEKDGQIIKAENKAFR